ncbi:MAG: nicotinamidase [Bryocella sp.]
MQLEPQPTDVLIVIDMQRDFLPDTPEHHGALAVAGGDEIIPGIHALAARFAHVVLTQDWHPRGHISFASTYQLEPFTATIDAPYGKQSLWPDHCVQGTPGADIDPRLDITHAELLLRKGFRQEIDSYSAFLENDHMTPTGLAGYLNERQLQRLFFVGLAFDFCVGSSAVDAVKLGFEAVVIDDLTRDVGIPGSVEAMNDKLATAGVRRLR